MRTDNGVPTQNHKQEMQKGNDMKKQLTYATLCSGIECMSAAVEPLGGWKPVFFSEIEPFPCALLKHRYPTVPNLGDLTKIKADIAQISDELKRLRKEISLCEDIAERSHIIEENVEQIIADEERENTKSKEVKNREQFR